MTTRNISAILLFVAALLVQHAQGDKWDQDYGNAMVDCCIEKGGTLKYLQVDTLCEFDNYNSYLDADFLEKNCPEKVTRITMQCCQDNGGTLGYLPDPNGNQFSVVLASCEYSGVAIQADMYLDAFCLHPYGKSMIGVSHSYSDCSKKDAKGQECRDCCYDHYQGYFDYHCNPGGYGGKFCADLNVFLHDACENECRSRRGW